MTLKQTQQTKTPSKSTNSIVFICLLIAYGLITIITPRMGAFDSNGPKFFTLSVLNIITFTYLFTRKNLQSESNWQFKFFNTKLGLVYSGLLIVSLLSFINAINVVESVLHFTKILTVFSAAFLISILFTLDKKMLLYLSVAMVGLLIIDCITVYSNIIKYITGELETIAEVKSIYANKNIFASSIFVKTPFALWLMVFRRKELQILGIIGTFMAILATFFLSTRSFYLGIFMLTIVLIIFLTVQYQLNRDKYNLRLMGIYTIILLASFLIFSISQSFLYPKTNDRYNKDLVSKLSSINEQETSSATRIDAWNRSFMVLKANPILGVGIGNWKIATLKDASQTLHDFTITTKAHSDFVEITTETGIIGGLMFVAIFIIAGLYFIRYLIKLPNQEIISLLFVPSLGLFCYSIDALVNFPQDRPEIQALFAIFVGSLVAVISQVKSPVDDSQKKPSKINDMLKRCSSNTIQHKAYIGIGFFVVLMTTSFVLYMNFKSLRLQQIVYDDFSAGRLEHSASMLLDEFPPIPNLGAMNQPIAVQKARYLIAEQRYNEAIITLKADNSSPFDGRREYFIASAYFSKGELDSCIAYSMRCFNIKPYFFFNLVLLNDALSRKGQHAKGEALVDSYLYKIRQNKDALLLTSSYYNNIGNTLRAKSLMDSAYKYFPTDEKVLKQIEEMGMVKNRR